MKSLIIILITLFCVSYSFAQNRKIEILPVEPVEITNVQSSPQKVEKYELRLTNAGWTNNQDSLHNYMIYLCDGLDCSEIYSTIYKYFSSEKYSKEKEIKGNPNSLITLQSMYNGAIVDNKDDTYYNIKYNLNIDIKDGKIRFNYPTVIECWIGLPLLKTDIGSHGFEKTIKEPYVKLHPFENIVNLHIHSIIRALKEEQKNKDW